MASPPAASKSRPAAPFIAPFSGDMDQRLAMIASEVSRKATLGSEPVFAALLLQSPNGSLWRITVSDSGAMHTDQVPL